MTRTALLHVPGATFLALAMAACGHEAAPPAAAPLQVEVAPAKTEAPPSAGAGPAKSVEPESAKAASSTSEADPGEVRPPAAEPGAAGAPDPALGRARTTPSIRQGATTVTGMLPPEVVQRIIRQNFGRFRLCYESGLAKNEKLGGRVTAKFTIDTTGAVSHLVDGGSDLPNKDVVACVVRGFANLSFPRPDGGGTAAVVYPIIFAPGTK